MKKSVKPKSRVPVVRKIEPVEPLILHLRGQKVILDADLAEIYGVQTKVLNQAVKRNADRFPEDFMFQLTADEWISLRSQIVTLNENVVYEQDTPNRSQIVTGSRKDEAEKAGSNRSQFATGSQKHRDPRFLPRVFTEHGAMMAATVLNSPKAVEMSVFVVRAFVRMREHLVANVEILKRLAEIDRTLLEHNQSLSVIWQQLQPLTRAATRPSKKENRV